MNEQMLPESLTQADIETYARLDAQLKKLERRHAAIKDKIRKAHNAQGIIGKAIIGYPSDKYGEVVIEFGVQKRVDLVAAEAGLPEAKYPGYYEPRLIQRLVPAKVLDKYRTPVQTLSVTTIEEVVFEGEGVPAPQPTPASEAPLAIEEVA